MKQQAVTVKKKVAIVSNTLGCEKINQYFAALEKYFISNGWEVMEHFDVDKVIIAGCGFHDSMYEKVLKVLADLEKINFLAKDTFLVGCVPKTHEQDLKNDFHGHIVPYHEEEILDRLLHMKISFKTITPTNLFRPHKEIHIEEEDRFFYIKIAEGCLMQCTFCIIKKAKGSIRSVPPAEIIRQFKNAVAQGKTRIHLMAEDTFAYGIDTGTTIIHLINTLLDIEPHVAFYFGSLHINWLSKYANEIRELCKRGVIKELYIGLQHVNDQLLKKMGRPVRFSHLYDILRTLKQECPDLFVMVDIMVGFPGETQEIFRQLVDFFRADKIFDKVRHFGYCDVKGAASTRFPDKVPAPEIIDRWTELDKVLGDRSSYHQVDNPNRIADATYERSVEKDYFFCKNTFMEEPDVIYAGEGLRRAASSILKTDNPDFGF
jgi:MiaB/RimO family radical SAM methylthiotransferase